MGFENFIQVNLAGLLKKMCKGHVIRVESHRNASADILILDSDETPKVAIAIKIVRLGKIRPNQGGVQMPKILEDIGKLKEFQFPEKALLCVVYQCGVRGIEKRWGDLGNKNGADYRESINNKINENANRSNDYPVPNVHKFGEMDGRVSLNGLVDLFVF
ncbi:MAG: hypothetical protein BWZ03_00836 [bacterium ADurb.BinA186]|nr:MAG: hypothetical protein BWZ03_00836 [bacterium ADurb.BinA186]